MTDIDWRQMLLAYLHDPPDKALDLLRHKSRALAWLKAVGLDVTESDLRSVQTQDVKAATEDRLPMPNPRARGGFDDGLAVSFLAEASAGDRFLIRHPLSGASFQLSGIERQGADLLRDPRVDAFLADLRRLPSDRARFLALWRFLPGVLAEVDPLLEHLPAETRAPDHGIFSHLDLTAAFQAATADGLGGALLSFTIGPVQGFIAQARSLKDLWSGSYLLSWLTFAAMTPILERLGPTALIYPALRANPLCDRWLCSSHGQDAPFRSLLDGPDRRAALLTASIPNVFVALVPTGEAERLEAAALGACRDAWSGIAKRVHERLAATWSHGPAERWDLGWQQQIDGFWDLRAVSLPLRPGGEPGLEQLRKHFTTHLWADCWPSKEISDLESAVRSDGRGYGEKGAAPGSWAMHNELLGRLMAASKNLRHIPPHSSEGGERAKCSLMGTLEQMGPGGSLRAQQEFWRFVAESGSLSGTYVRSGERLSAVALVKRFAWATFFADELGAQPSELRYSDTATIAAHHWLNDAGIDPKEHRSWSGHWSGQWLFQSPSSWGRTGATAGDGDPPPDEGLRKALEAALRSKDRDAPRPYYAVIALDGDEIGQWLRGARAPSLRNAYHPKLVGYFEGLSGKLPPGSLDAKRPMSPALHAAMTSALGHFSRSLVPEIVGSHHGELVYAGGDDVLALLPTQDAVACARALRFAYSGNGDTSARVPPGWLYHTQRLLTLMGETATASAGLAVAHYKADLRDTIQASREAEHAAKQAGRDALGIAILRRSGERSLVVCPWHLVPKVETLVSAFLNGASDKWAYQLRRSEETLCSLPPRAVEAEIRRVIERSDHASLSALRAALQVPEGASVGGDLAGLYRALLEEAIKPPDRSASCPGLESSDASAQASLVQSRALLDFIALVQTASFLARGREE